MENWNNLDFKYSRSLQLTHMHHYFYNTKNMNSISSKLLLCPFLNFTHPQHSKIAWGKSRLPKMVMANLVLYKNCIEFALLETVKRDI